YSMATTAAPSPVKSPERREHVTREFGWNVLVWNDPITLMSYVVLVFRRLFGYDQAHAAGAQRGSRRGCHAAPRAGRGHGGAAPRVRTPGDPGPSVTGG